MGLDQDLRTFLEHDGPAIVGLTTPNGHPFATRAWGIVVTDPVGGSIRVLLDRADQHLLAERVAGGSGAAIAITMADIRTLRSVQVKGRVTALDPPDDADHARAAAFCDGLFDSVHEVDGTARHLLERLRPLELVAATVLVESGPFDQTPGPGAGAALSTGGQ